jgi:hypothetical protein
MPTGHKMEITKVSHHADGKEFSDHIGFHTDTRNAMPPCGNERASGYGHRRDLGMPYDSNLILL